MPRAAKPADDKTNVRKDNVTIEEPQDDDGALALLLDLDDLGDEPEIEDDVEDEQDDDQTGDPGFSQIFKAEKVGAALKVANGALSKLMGAINAIKKLGDKPISPQIAKVLNGVAGALNLMAGGDKGGAEKADEGILKQATSAMERLMAMVNKLKGMSGDEDVPDAIFSEANAIAGVLKGIAGGDKEDDKGGKDDEVVDEDKKTTKKRFEVFVPRDADADDSDPEIIIKAGAKMKRTRLGKLKQAVKLLTEVLGEISPEESGDKDAKKDKKKGKVKKSDGEPSTLEAAIASVVETVKDLGERVDKLSGEVKGKMEDMTKRVSTLEGEPPAPTETDDEDAQQTSVKKKDEQPKSIFHNIVHQA